MRSLECVLSLGKSRIKSNVLHEKSKGKTREGAKEKMTTCIEDGLFWQVEYGGKRIQLASYLDRDINA